MSAVMIRCPTSGRAVSTAIETEPGDFRRLPTIAARMRCPACGRDHVWTVRSAWLDGAPKPAAAPLRLLESSAEVAAA
jgi:endogenous inhibitor of DNA gyrase (YacG/DUF329 family)